MKVGLKRIAIGAVIVAACGATAVATRPRWQGWLDQVRGVGKVAASEADEHAGHDHGGGEAKPVLTLSDQAKENLGLEMAEIQLSDYWRTIQIPGVVSEQQGHSERRIPATVAGIVTKLYIFPGQSVRPGDPLMDVQPTSELLTAAQAALLRTLQDIELIDIELKRITPLVESGALPAKNKIEKEYERRRLESQQLVQTQELLVRGLAPDQIGTIVESKILIRKFTVRVPGGKVPAMDAKALLELPRRGAPRIMMAALVHEVSPVKEPEDLIYSVESIDVFPGKLVQPGDVLVDLALHTELNIAGQAFERDSPLILRTMQEKWGVTATFETADGTPLTRDNMKIRYLESTVDGLSRIQKFHIPLVNQILRETTNDDGIAYHAWLFRPGQRVRLSVPVEKLTERIVLPADAVIQEGADAYVFRTNGKLLERTAVVLEHLDGRTAVIKNDGTLTPDFDVVAKNHAYQLNLELKKKLGEGGGGGGHEGHNH
ncbi:MAG: efflux RND transporter periplasmic adaptor subunit [Bdellovibrionales bacterium]|nr:efflux RND transporter periplasmic adaptor subunit [Bdellovibrionales bacterium]